MIHYDDIKYTGLSEEEVSARILKDGYNELSSAKPKNLFQQMIGIIKEPMFQLLVACGVLYMILGDITEGIMLLGFVFVIMGIEFYQERKTEKALNALKDLSSPRALAIRDGTEKRIAGRDVVRDDILILQEGDRVPADALILNSINLKADESLLTGESIPVHKIIWDGITENKHPGGDELPFVYSGSMIVQGTGIAKVIATGNNTELGKIGKAIESVAPEKTKLQKEMSRLVKTIFVFGIILCVLVVIIYTYTRFDLIKGMLAGITLAMAMLPEEFPVVLTVFLALGAWRISRKNVLTRKPSAIETLGSATVLCTDKTGTLTENKMTVTKLYNGMEFLEVKKDSGFPEPFHEIIEYGILSSQARPFDPMEKAILQMGDIFLKGTEHIHHDWEMIKEYPLSKEMLAMSRAFSLVGVDEKTIAAKGAPEAIFDLCHLNPEIIEKYSTAAEIMASEGMRVLGVAKAKINSGTIPDIQHDFDFHFVGLIGLTDPIRKNVAGAVEECYKAGIRVIMITGDYPVTAVNIAKEIGLKNYEKVISGAELEKMSDEELSEKIKEVNVFARVVPEQKLKIVNALKRNNEVVAMTGDGINDAPALKAANIGIAMGEKGTDVAREASSLVLMDDNFLSIVSAVKMGRRITDNLQKALGYIFSIHIPIAGLSFIPVLFSSLPLMLWPVHIVFLELIIDPACTMVFEAEAEEKNVMSRPPADINKPFFGADKILLSCLQGIGILIVVLAVYFYALNTGLDEGAVRAMSFISLIVANIAVILTNRSWTKNIFSIILSPNYALKWVTGGAVLFLIIIVNTPFFVKLFKFDEIGYVNTLISIAAGIISITWFEMYKLYRKIIQR